MELKFDLAPDEFPVFMAETDEQLQVLDEGLIRLEREGEDMDLLQNLFRAAHTLKGTSGMIGHKRMVTLTHALETAFDGLRKHTLPVTSVFIDLCLEAVDALGVLRQEVVLGKQSPVDVERLTNRFTELVLVPPSPGVVSAQKPGVEPPGGGTAEVAVAVPGGKRLFIQTDISPDSVASSARAFQVMLMLQSFGTILGMTPSQEEIETAQPVTRVTAFLDTASSANEVRLGLETISDIQRLMIEPEGAQHRWADLATRTTAPGDAVQAAAAGDAVQAPAVGAAVQAAKAVVEKTVRTSVERLDNLMNLVGELITDRNRLYQIRSNLDINIQNNTQADVLSETIAHIGRITDQLQMEVMSIRMLPVSNVFNKFPRMVRDLANRIDKEVDLIIEGENTELDRSVIEEITDPLIHLIRNSVDHGVEKPNERVQAGKPERAKVMLTARHEQSHIVITVEDDGKGIDLERVKASAIQKGLVTEQEAPSLSNDDAINLVFASGLSTKTVVSDVSGRGVGLDIVRANIQRLNGSIITDTWKGRGTRFQITLPLTLAIVPTLLVGVGKNNLAIPLAAVLETLRLSDKDIQTINSKPVIRLRDKVLPILYLSEAYNFKDTRQEQGFYHVVVVGQGKQKMGLVVDRLLGQEEVVVKTLGNLIGDVLGISSAAILGDGQVILIVDTQDLFKMTGLTRSAGW